MLCNLKSHPVSSGMLPQLLDNFRVKTSPVKQAKPPPRLERGLTDYKSVRLPLADRGIFRPY